MITLTNRDPNQRILELGGGANPVVIPTCMGGKDVNVDVRDCFTTDGVRTTDFTANFDEPLPIADNDFDHIVCQYCLEHVSWRKVRQFISEMFRIVKSGGKVTVVTSNTQAQFEWILKNPEGWDGKDLFESASCIIYGDNDYPENTHRAFFTPGILGKLFADAGFAGIDIRPYGARDTDISVVATKPDTLWKGETAEIKTIELDVQKLPMLTRNPYEAAKVDERKKAVIGFQGVLTQDQPPFKAGEIVQQVMEAKEEMKSVAAENMPREEMFDKHYFNGGGKVGGYAAEGYRDFPVHEITFRHLMMRMPTSVLEIGAARGYIGKRLEDAKIPYLGLEISKHCWMTRVCDRVVHKDICNTPWAVGDGGTVWQTENEVVMLSSERCWDVSFSIATLEHIPEQYIPAVLRELGKRCRRHIHAIDFGDNDDGFDKTHCFPAGTKVLMGDGSNKNIEDVCVGDEVMGLNPDKSWHPTLVSRLYRHTSDTFATITLSSGEKLTGTLEHPVWVRGRGWTHLGNIQEGDEVFYAREEVFSDRETARVHPSQLHDNELQADSGEVKSRLALASTLRDQEDGFEAGTLGKVCMERRGEGETGKALFHYSEEKTTQDVSWKNMDEHTSCVSTYGVNSVSSDQFGEKPQSDTYETCNGGLHSRSDRRGGVGLHTGGKVTEQTGEASGFGTDDWEYRSQDDRFCELGMRRDSQHKASDKQCKGIQVPVLRLESSGVPGTPVSSIGNSLHDYQEESGSGGNGVSSSTSVATKEFTDRRGGVRLVCEVATVVSKEEFSRMGVEVFNLETEEHTYFANGVYVHNCTLRSKEWWATQFSNAGLTNYEIVNKESFERWHDGQFPEEALKNKGNRLKLNVGCFTTMFHHGWVNIDVHDLGGWAGTNGYQYMRHDIRNPLPFNTGDVDYIFMSHFLEHLNPQEALNFLKECRRLLKPATGAMRIIVPDAKLLTRLYHEGGKDALKEYAEINDGVDKAKTSLQRLQALLYTGHQSFYDEQTMIEVLGEADFMCFPAGLRYTQVDRCEQILKETTEMGFELSLFSDAIPTLPSFRHPA